MEHEHYEDSIDDLISILNFQKSKEDHKENRYIKIEADVSELGDLLNSPFMKFQHKAFLSSKNSTTQPQKLITRPMNATLKPTEKLQTKNDIISRNFLSKTLSHPLNRDSAQPENENSLNKEEINITSFKVAQTNIPTRYLIFQPILKDIKLKPKTPPDSGYYFKFSGAEVKLIKYLLEENGFRECNNNYSFTILWNTGPIKNEIYQCLGYYQKVNHFPRSHEITRKDSMHRNISNMQTTYGLKNFNFIPKSFILPTELSLLQNDAEKNKGMWYIVKPQASSQGRGIFITNDLDEIIPKQHSNIIVSHYLNDPYLINGLKFDLRVYVAITCVHPLRIYIYKEGLVRFATTPYAKDGDSYANRFIHLTNYSINKRSENYIAGEEGEEANEFCSKWTFATFQTYLESQGINYKEIFNKIEDLVVKTVISVESILFTANINQVSQRHNCFELLGFDILLDSKLKPWLLEVNLSPSLACDSPLDLKVKKELISDLFNLAGVIPLDQRTHTESNLFGKNQNLFSYGVNVPNFDKKPTGYNDARPLENLTKEEKTVIRETNEEWERRGKFKRIFPSVNVNDYKNYFEADRPFNKLLRNVILSNMKKDTKKSETYKPFQNPKKFG